MRRLITEELNWALLYAGTQRAGRGHVSKSGSEQLIAKAVDLKHIHIFDGSRKFIV